MTGDPHAFVAEKLERVFGPARAAALLADVLREIRKERVDSAQAMYDAGVVLERRGGIEAGVGAILKVQAILRDRTVRTG